MQLKGLNISTHAIFAYQCVCSRSTVENALTQREKCLKRNNMPQCLRKHFISDLINFITSLSDGDNRIILAANANEHTVDGKLAKELKRMGMIDAFFKKFNAAGLASHVLGSAPIDGV